MRILLNNTSAALLFIIIVSSAVFIPLIGNCHLFDWDEINFAECAREMVVTGNYSSVQLNYNPFWEKPPFFIWLQALSMNVFGVNEFAARFPNAVCGIITFCVIFLIGKKVNSPNFGLTWVLIYAGTLLPHFYFKSGIIDPWFNLFIFLSFYQILNHINNPVKRSGLISALLSGFFVGIATLTKGPVAIMIIFLFICVFWMSRRFVKLTETKFVIVFFISLLFTGSLWFIVEILRGNADVIKAFFDYQVRLFNTEDSDHGGIFFYHFIVLLIGCFPASLLLILSFKKSLSDTPFQKHIKTGMLILFFIVLLVFSFVKTKIVHYSSLCYLPLTYLAAYSLFKLMSEQYKLKTWFYVFFVVLSALIGFAFSLMGLINYFKPFLLKHELIDDVFAVENLKAQVYWAGWEWIPGLLFVIVSILGIWFVRNGKTKAFYYIYTFYVIFIITCINTFTPKIEQYSQRAAIEFYKAIAEHHFYVETSGFKSYAYLFYTNKQPSQNQNKEALKDITKTLNEMEAEGHSRLSSFPLAYLNWMQWGKIDKPAIVVCKVNNEADLLKNRLLTKLYAKNGYVFFVRMPYNN